MQSLALICKIKKINRNSSINFKDGVMGLSQIFQALDLLYKTYSDGRDAKQKHEYNIDRK